MKTPTVKMVWTGPDKTFPGRRRRTKGDEISASRMEARTFRALGWATDAPEQVAPAPVPAPQADALDALRAQYEAAKGTPPDRRWGTARLRAEIAAGGTYGRRDMRAGS